MVNRRSRRIPGAEVAAKLAQGHCSQPGIVLVRSLAVAPLSKRRWKDHNMDGVHAGSMDFCHVSADALSEMSV